MREKLRNMKIGRQLIYSFVLIIILYIFTVTVSVLNFKDVSTRMDDLYSEQFANVQASLNMISNIQSVGRSLVYMCVDTEIHDMDERLEAVRSTIEKIESNLSFLSQGYVVDKDKIEELGEKFEALEEPRDKVVAFLEENKIDQAFLIYQKEYEPKADIVRTTLNEVVELCTADAENSMADTSRQNNKVMVLMIMIAVIVLVLTVFTWWVVTRSILVPIQAVKNAANDIAKGQLDIELAYSSTNELGELAQDVRDTADALNSYVAEIRRGMLALGSGKLNYHSDVDFKGDFVAVSEAMADIAQMLRDSMQQINNSAEQVSVGAEQVSNGAQALAQGASEQTSSIEELAVSINEVADSVRDNAENAVKSCRLAELTGKGIIRSDHLMEELMKSIEQIRKNSRQITGVVKEIEDIAFQTNILALNASVEAARAGDAGKGFSVVAGEVRRLAAKTTSASKLTAELIDKNAEAVEDGSTAVSETADALKKSVENAREVNDMVENISSVSVQQAEAITQIRKSMELISEIVQGNSATSEESAAASEELSAQAQLLKDLVEQFEF